MNEDQPTTENDAVIQELVAYLDGELDAQTSTRVEQRLTEDAAYRTQLQQLQRTWDLLDELPRPSIGETFTQSTVEMVALKAAGEAQTKTGAARSRRSMFWATIATTVLIASIGGYLIGHRVADTENRQVLQDLPVIENVDLYSNADSIDFLLSLEEEGLFTEELEPSTGEEADDVQ